MLTVEDQKLFEDYMKQSKQTTKSSIRKFMDYLTGLEEEIPLNNWRQIYKEHIDEILQGMGMSTSRRYNADINKFLKIVTGDEMKVIKEDNKNNEELIKSNAVSITNRLNEKHEYSNCNCKEKHEEQSPDNTIQQDIEALIHKYNILDKTMSILEDDIKHKQEKLGKLAREKEVNNSKQASLMRKAFNEELLSWK